MYMTMQRLVEDYRNETLENIHHGQICVVDEYGELLYEVGDSSTMTYLRSAAKPFQALNTFIYHADEKFGINEREAAIFMASQRGESYHQEVLASVQRKLQMEEDILICSPAYPLNDAPKEQYIYDHQAKRKLLHNCAGKHLGMLALAKTLGEPLETYGDLHSRVQQMSLDAMAYMASYPRDDIQLGIDGCGFPVYALPLRHIAKAYMKLANPSVIADDLYRQAAAKVTRLMNDHPEMIASHDFICTVLLKDPNIVAKGGAKGVYGIGLKKEKIGIALKVMDGSEAVWPQIVSHILQALDYANKDTIKALHELSPSTITNDGGIIVGERKVVFDLTHQV